MTSGKFISLSQVGAEGKRENSVLKMKGCELGQDWANVNVRKGVNEILDGEVLKKMVSYLNICPISSRGCKKGKKGKNATFTELTS